MAILFPLHLIYYKREKILPQFSRSVSNDTKVCPIAAPREFYESENRRKCAELEWKRISNDSMELNDTELNYIYFGGETDSDDASNSSDEHFVLLESLFYFNKLTIVRPSERFSVRDILQWRTHFIFPNVEFLWFF